MQPYDPNDPRRFTAGAVFDQAAGINRRPPPTPISMSRPGVPADEDARVARAFPNGPPPIGYGGPAVTAGQSFDQAAGGATPGAMFDRAATTPLRPTPPSMAGQIPQDPPLAAGPIAAASQRAAVPQAPQAPGRLPPGGGYFLDQMSEAGDMISRGNVAGGVGRGVAGLASSVPVAVGEAFYRAGQDLAPAVDVGKRFAMGMFGMEPGTANAQPGPSVQVPRGPTARPGSFAPNNEGPLGVGVNGQQPQPQQDFGPNQSVQVPQRPFAPGPISAAMSDEAQARAVMGNPFINAELQRIQAAENQGQQQKINAMQQNVGYAQAWTQQRDAESNARVANFAAKNGADMVLAGGISRNQNPQQLAILAAQKDANEKLNLANANMTNAANPKPQNRDYIQELNRQQLTDQKGQELSGRAARGQAEAQTAQMDAAAKKQLIELQQRLLTAKTPEERREIENMILALHGRAQPQDKVAVIDVDTGQRDMMGQPIYKKAAVNTVTGQIVGDPGAAGRGPDPVAALKSLGVDQAHAQAKQAIAAGAKLADVNARLKAAGFPTL